jgi:hypothetical protein
MTRVRPAEEKDLTSAFRARVEQAGSEREAVQWRVFGLCPDMYRDYLRFYFSAHDGGVLNPAVKEIVRLRIAQLNDCPG